MSSWSISPSAMANITNNGLITFDGPEQSLRDVTFTVTFTDDYGNTATQTFVKQGKGLNAGDIFG